MSRGTLKACLTELGLRLRVVHNRHRKWHWTVARDLCSVQSQTSCAVPPFLYSEMFLYVDPQGHRPLSCKDQTSVKPYITNHHFPKHTLSLQSAECFCFQSNHWKTIGLENAWTLWSLTVNVSYFMSDFWCIYVLRRISKTRPRRIPTLLFKPKRSRVIVRVVKRIVWLWQCFSSGSVHTKQMSLHCFCFIK